MEMAFPIESFLQVKQELIVARRELEKEQAAWQAVRDTLNKKQAKELDEQFRTKFENLGYPIFYGRPLEEMQDIQEAFQALVLKGASARLLGNHELGNYNVAQFIKDIINVTDRAMLEIVAAIIRAAIVAGADMLAQKAYAGNGGSVAQEWVCEYLARGIGEYAFQNLDQYACCYKIFPWLTYSKNDGIHPFCHFIAALKASPEVASWQQKMLLAIIAHGFSPCMPDNMYQSVSFFRRVAYINVTWLTLLFPFENEHLKPYLEVLKPDITPEVIKNLVNAFTSNNKNRKHFKAFFSSGSHWLLQLIRATAPDIIFDLVRRNEHDLLVPFLKNCKPAITELRDQNENTLLHQAALNRGLAEKTIQLLRNARFSLQAINNEGLTPLALALKNNRTDLIKWLQ